MTTTNPVEVPEKKKWVRTAPYKNKNMAHPPSEAFLASRPNKKVAFTKKLKRGYLELLRKNNGNQSKTCREISVSVSSLNDHKKSDPWFKQAHKDVLESLNDDVLAEIHRRGVVGVDKTLYYQGEEMGVERQYSDSLLLALAKSKNEDFNTNTNIKIEADITSKDAGSSKEKLLALMGYSKETLEGDFEEIPEEQRVLITPDSSE